MATADDIIPSYQVDPCGGPVCFTVQTLGATHLRLAWSFFEPKKTQKWRTVRGVRQPCGFTYEMQYPQCVEQQQAGNSVIHTFCLPPIVTDRCIWYTLTTSCIFKTKPASTPPQKYCFSDCAPGIHAWRVDSSFFGNVPQAPNWGSISWETINYDPSNCLGPAPVGIFNICWPSVTMLRWSFTFEIFPGQPSGAIIQRIRLDGTLLDQVYINTVLTGAQRILSTVSYPITDSLGSHTLQIEAQSDPDTIIRWNGGTTAHWCAAEGI